MTSLDPGRSPCSRHPCSVEHADVVLSFREAVRLYDEEAERVTGGYDRELARYLEDHPRPNLKTYLITRGQSCPTS
ncbi:hypothetical protein [Amycolatopsis lexingtonensis]|uniref:hypothetical protein n=1 Tax=Amycolatopsis lexingtonensis TaxID=218822 RepID=UPI003F70CF9A